MHRKRDEIIRLLLIIAIILAVALLGSFWFFKWDLTSEKRHTLTESTQEMLGQLDDEIMVRCYLHGDFPASFKRLEQAIRERLTEFRDYSNDQLHFEFIDPYSSNDEKTIAETEQALYDKGLRFTRLSYTEDGAKKFKTIWPAAIVDYKGEEYPVQFFKSEMPEPTEGMINSSVNNLEYELATNLRKAMKSEKAVIGILQGHGELNALEMADFTAALEEQYAVDYVTIDGKLSALSDKLEGVPNRTNKHAALIIAKPDSVFSWRDKTIIDQFIMNGGKVLWLIDPLNTDLDSLRTQQQTIATTNENGLYEVLFQYGVRLNRDLMIDPQCAVIAFDTGPMGNQRNTQLFNWYYAPVLMAPDTAHPIVANLDPIVTDFTSSLEFVGDDNTTRKTVLLRTSPLSKELKAPVRVNSAIVNFGPEYFEQGTKPNQPVAVLLEGKFSSAVQDFLPDTLKRDPVFANRTTSVNTAMIVIADGDIARNRVIQGQEGPVPVPLGYDRYAGKVIYDNKEFLLNCMNYLLDDAGLISVRSRSIELRKLNAEKIVSDKFYYQVINVVLPILLVLLLGFGGQWWRKRKWSVAGQEKV